MRRSLPCLVVLSSLAVFAGPVFAQSGDRRGLWFGLGVAPASVHAKCARCSADRKLGYAGYVHIGGSFSPRLRAGVEATGWRQSDPDSTREYGAVTLMVLLHPVPTSPVYLKVGVGAGRYAERGGSDLLSANGFATLLGAGADFRIRQRITIGPYVNYVFSNNQALKVNRLLQFTELDLNMVQFGVGGRWH